MKKQIIFVTSTLFALARIGCVTVLLLSLGACNSGGGGGGGGNSGDESNPPPPASNNWDQMLWDQGHWG
jgi:hypothetical protein